MLWCGDLAAYKHDIRAAINAQYVIPIIAGGPIPSWCYLHLVELETKVIWRFPKISQSRRGQRILGVDPMVSRLEIGMLTQLS